MPPYNLQPNLIVRLRIPNPANLCPQPHKLLHTRLTGLDQRQRALAPAIRVRAYADARPAVLPHDALSNLLGTDAGYGADDAVVREACAVRLLHPDALLDQYDACFAVGRPVHEGGDVFGVVGDVG